MNEKMNEKLEQWLITLRKKIMFDYSNIGLKLKTLARIILGIGILISVAYGFVLSNLSGTLVGLLIIPVGVIVSWFGSMPMYGFGQLIQNTDELVNLMKRELKKEEKNLTKLYPPIESANNEKFLQDIFKTEDVTSHE